MNKRSAILSFLAVLTLSQCVLSLEVPTFISFQGKLSNSSNGDPYYPASLSINITNQSQLTQVVWGPYTFNDATDSQGVYDIILGKANPLNLTPGWQYQLVVSVDIGSATYSTADLTFGDLNPSGDSILIQGSGPANAAQLLMADNVTTVQAAIQASGTGDITDVLTPADSGLQGGTSTGAATLSLTNCAAGQILKNQSGGWSCAADDGGTAYTALAGGGLNMTGSAFHLTNLCSAGQILKNQSGGWSCAADSDTTYTAQAGGGLNLTGTAFYITNICTPGQILKNQSGGWSCAADDVGAGATPYWIDVAGNITSNASIDGGNVHVMGNLSSGSSQAAGAYTVALGYRNTAGSGYAVVSGGYNNTAGYMSAVSGGDYNNASGQESVVSGGRANTASGSGAFVGGGGFFGASTAGNTASGVNSVVTGGRSNAANASESVVSGGRGNLAGNQYAVVSGGFANVASGDTSAILGGQSNTASNIGSVVMGGTGNTASGMYSATLGGWSNIASGNYSAAGGDFSTASGDYSFAFGGLKTTEARGKGSVAMGYAGDVGTTRGRIYALGDGSFAMGRALGEAGPGGLEAYINSTGIGSFAVGYATPGNSVAATGKAGVAMGENVLATGNNGYALGANYTNAQASSLMVGWGSPMLVVNQTGVYANGSIVTPAAASTPYWITNNSYTTSNISINSGSVNVTGNLSASGDLSVAGRLTGPTFLNVTSGTGFTLGIAGSRTATIERRTTSAVVEDDFGLKVFSEVSPTADVLSKGYYGISSDALGNTNYLTAGFVGVEGRAYQYGSGNTTLTGVQGYVKNKGTAYVSDAAALAAVGVFNDGAGTINNAYGLYIDTLTGGTNKWDIYTLGPRTYLGGNLGVGFANPTFRLQVNGTMNVTGNVTFGSVANCAGKLYTDAGGMIQCGTDQTGTATPNWIDLDGNTTSNASINQGNVHILGNLSSGTSQAAGAYSVALGYNNLASNTYASVLGGSSNTASGDKSVVSGGWLNTVNSQWSVVAGGDHNFANGGQYDVIGGGDYNYAQGPAAVVAGGRQNNASSAYASVLGGRLNFAFGTSSVVSGGQGNTASGDTSVVSGGNQNAASNSYSIVSGGRYNSASGYVSIVPGGYMANASGNYSLAAGYNVQAGTATAGGTQYTFAFGRNYTNSMTDSFGVGFATQRFLVNTTGISFFGDIRPNGTGCASGQILQKGGSSWNCVAMPSSLAPYWINQSGYITSNSSINGGNVYVSGANLTFASGNGAARLQVEDISWAGGDNLTVKAGTTTNPGSTGGTLFLDAGSGDTPGTVAIASANNAKVGIGTAFPDKMLAVAGNASVAGDLWVSGSIHGVGADLAERFSALGDSEEGDVMVIVPGENETLAKSSKPYDRNVAGVVSTDPSHILNDGENGPPIALAGRVPVKVSSEGGPISSGDLLVTSSSPGYAMKCADEAKCSGATVGKALQPFTGDKGIIKMLVTLK